MPHHDIASLQASAPVDFDRKFLIRYCDAIIDCMRAFEAVFVTAQAEYLDATAAQELSLSVRKKAATILKTKATEDATMAVDSELPADRTQLQALVTKSVEAALRKERANPNSRRNQQPQPAGGRAPKNTPRGQSPASASRKKKKAEPQKKGKPNTKTKKNQKQRSQSPHGRKSRGKSQTRSRARTPGPNSQKRNGGRGAERRGRDSSADSNASHRSRSRSRGRPSNRRTGNNRS